MFPVSDVIPSRTRPYITIALIALNAAAFAWELALGDDLPRVVRATGLVPLYFSWTSIPTSLILHAGWVHVIGNLLYLWLFGDNVEGRLGHWRFLLFYLLCGVAAAIVHTAMHPNSLVPAIGAGGAVSGVLGAYFVFYPQSRILLAVFLIVFFELVEVMAVFFLGIWFLLPLFVGVGSIGTHARSLAFEAHIATFLLGAIAALAWRWRIPYR